MSRAANTATIRHLLDQATTCIDSDTARLDAEVLLCFVLGKPRSHLHAWPDKIPDPQQQARYTELITRRAHGEPVAYLCGQREFWSLPVTVNSSTLIPRPETEALVERALEVIPGDRQWRIADLGTGSGAIALAIAHERPSCCIVASDSSQAALDTAVYNANQLNLGNIEFVNGHWCDALAAQKFDLIVSNPPYIEQHDPHLLAGDVRFEPRSALASGADGMNDLTSIAQCARNHLSPGAWLMLEHGHDQGLRVRELLKKSGYHDIYGHRDASGHERIAEGRA